MRPGLLAALSCLALASCASRAPAQSSANAASSAEASAGEESTFVERTREKLAREQQEADRDARRDEYTHRQRGKSGD